MNALEMLVTGCASSRKHISKWFEISRKCSSEGYYSSSKRWL